MLKIIIEDKYFLDLPSNLEIQITDGNPLFEEDSVIAPYSLSFEVPPTPNNLQKLGYPTRVTSKAVKFKVIARVISNEINYSTGELIIVGFDQNIKLQYVGTVDDLDIETPLNELDLYFKAMGAVCTVNSHYSPSYGNYTYYSDVCQQIADSQSPFANGPVRIGGTDWDATGYTDGGLNANRQYINYYTPGDNGYYFGNFPTPHYAEIHSPIMPFLYIKNILTRVFGSNLVNNPFATGDMAKLCLIAENHPKYNINNLTLQDGNYPQQYWVSPLRDNDSAVYGPNLYDVVSTFKNYQQKYPFNQLIKEICKIFGMSIYSGSAFEFLTDDNILQRDAVLKLDDYLVGDLSAEYTQTDTEYVFQYGSSGTDRDDSEKKVDNIMAAITDINLDTKRFQTEYEYQDLSTGKIFTLKKTLRGLTNDVWYEFKTVRSELLQTKDSTIDNKYSVTSEVTPLEMSIEQYWSINDGGNDLIPRNHWHVPIIERDPVESAPHIMLSYGMTNTVEDTNVTYPLITNHNYDIRGNRLGDISLLPNGADGVVNKFQSTKRDWINKRKQVVKGSFNLTEQTNRNLKIFDKVYLKGKNWLIKNREYSLSHQGISLVDLELVEDL